MLRNGKGLTNIYRDIIFSAAVAQHIDINIMSTIKTYNFDLAGRAF